MTDQKSPGSGRTWLRVLFGLSLAMNLLVLGLAAGAVLRFGGPGGMRPPPKSLGTALFHELPPEDRRELRSQMQDHGARNAALRKAEAEAIGAALRQTPFDPDGVAEVLAGGARQREAWMNSVHSAWLERIGRMSDAERIEFADRLQESLSRIEEKRGDRDGKKRWKRD